MARRYRRQASGKFVGSAVAAGIGLAVLSGHHGGNAVAEAGHGTHAATAAIVRGTVSGGTLSCSGLEALWEQAGGSPRAAFLAAEIAMAESSGSQYATMHNTNGTTDRGFWQVNSIHGPLSTYGAYANARSAVLISSDGRDWSPWTAYRTGAYAGKC